MAASAVRLLSDGPTQRRMAVAARRTAQDRFCDTRIVPLYEACYESVLARLP